MKICHLIFALESGGSENLLIDIANQQSKSASVSVIIVNNRINASLLSQFSGRVSVYRLNRSESDRFSFIPILRLWSLLIFIRPQVIHCHNHKLARLIYPWKSRAAFTIHTIGVPTTNLPTYRKVFAISKAVRSDIAKRCSISAEVIYNGIDTSRVFRKTSYEFSKTLPFKLIQVSRLDHTIKGQDLALKALQSLHSRGYTNIHLSFIGEGPSLQYLQQEAKNLDIEDSVEFLGIRDRRWLFENLYNYDLLVQPSLLEGFGLTIIEGIAAGLPVVASDVDGPREILDGVPSGFLFTKNDTEEFVLAVEQVIRLTALGDIKQLCENAAHVISDRYSIQQTANQYMVRYPGALARKFQLT